MIAKINKGASLYGAVAYNQQKVEAGTARIFAGSKILTDIYGNPDRVMQQTLLSFEDYLVANKRTEKPVLHISLNPDPEDKLSNAEYAALAHDYMERMGYGNQPFIVYKHEDIDRKHIHIVSVCIDETGKKIPDNFEHKRSMEVCRDLEERYGLKNAATLATEDNSPYLKKVDYERGDIKKQIASVLRSVHKSYHFQSFGECNALLRSFNIEVKAVKGEHKGIPYQGIIYSALDGGGQPVGTPYKASLFGKSYGHEGLEKKMARCEANFKAGKVTPLIRRPISEVMRTYTTMEQFTAQLARNNIDVVFRQNDTGRIYGVTFIDHNERAVFNGSRLGREFSANVFNSLFTAPSPQSQLTNGADATSVQISTSDDSQASDFERDLNLIQTFGIASDAIDPGEVEEEAFARRMRKKKKNRGRSM